MKLQKLIYAILFLFLVGSVSAQVKDAKSNSDKEIVETGKIPNLLNSRTFEFIANTVFPASGTPQNLVGGNYSVRFYPELIISDLPFLGRVYSGMTMQKDRGMRFQGNPEKFNIEKGKNHKINAVVKDGDTYEISLSVSDSGFATLIISSSARGTISYHGEVVPISE